MSIEKKYVLVAFRIFSLSTFCARLTVYIFNVGVEIQVVEKWSSVKPVVMSASCMVQRGYVNSLLNMLVITESFDFNVCRFVKRRLQHVCVISSRCATPLRACIVARIFMGFALLVVTAVVGRLCNTVTGDGCKLCSIVMKMLQYSRLRIRTASSF